MFYSFDIPLPVNTPEDEPVELIADLTWGVITHVEVEFPPGCAGLAKVAILYHRHQLWPTNVDKWFYTDGKTIVWDDYFELFEPPFELVLLGYNDDDTYQHTPIVRFEVLPRKAIIALAVTDAIVQVLAMMYPRPVFMSFD